MLLCPEEFAELARNAERCFTLLVEDQFVLEHQDVPVKLDEDVEEMPDAKEFTDTTAERFLENANVERREEERKQLLLAKEVRIECAATLLRELVDTGEQT